MTRDPTLAAYVLLTLLLLWAAVDPWAPYQGPVAACQLGDVVDGDTVHIWCEGVRRTARLTGFDAPEIRSPRCPAEAALGAKATERLRALVASGPVRLYRQGFDKYGRDLVALTVSGRDVGDVLVAEGLAHRYHGAARGDWCG